MFNKTKVKLSVENKNNVIKQGWLVKWTNPIVMWKSRYFQLYPTAIKYKRSKEGQAVRSYKLYPMRIFLNKCNKTINICCSRCKKV